MRLTEGSTRDEIREELIREALATWGPDRLEALRPLLEDAARMIRALLDQPLDPLDGPPDPPALLR